MILYIQTPAIPRSALHDIGVNKALKFLDGCEHFSEIRWFVNLDVVEQTWKGHVVKNSDGTINIDNRTGTYKFEDYNITLKNFEDKVKELNKTKLFTTVSKNPCFYLAFRRLTLATQNDLKIHNTHHIYCRPPY